MEDTTTPEHNAKGNTLPTPTWTLSPAWCQEVTRILNSSGSNKGLLKTIVLELEVLYGQQLKVYANEPEVANLLATAQYYLTLLEMTELLDKISLLLSQRHILQTKEPYRPDLERLVGDAKEITEACASMGIIPNCFIHELISTIPAAYRIAATAVEQVTSSEAPAEKSPQDVPASLVNETFLFLESLNGTKQSIAQLMIQCNHLAVRVEKLEFQAREKDILRKILADAYQYLNFMAMMVAISIDWNRGVRDDAWIKKAIQLGGKVVNPVDLFCNQERVEYRLKLLTGLMMRDPFSEEVMRGLKNQYRLNDNSAV